MEQKVTLLAHLKPIKHISNISTGYHRESFYFIYLNIYRERESERERVGFTLQFSLWLRLRPNLTVEKPSIMEGTKNK